MASKIPAHFLGGNSLDAAPAGPVKDFVAAHGGHTVITKVLIANNGIAAVKEIRSVRKWAYETFGNERAVQFTVMATPEDLKVNAEYIRMADQYVEVPGGSNNNNYANVQLIVDVAERMKVHAVWAGWGHASENPKLPESLAKSKIVFIGPPGSAMRSLGDKISSTIVAQSAKVPCMDWSGTGIDQVVVDEETALVTVSDEVYHKACTHDPEEGLDRARKIGFPVMIKASEGGGGKGIRKVESEDNFVGAYEQVLSEVPGSPVFIMKLAGNARHLEVQLLADQYGNNISLFGRDCSVQRRHQKIIEEAPVTIAKPDTFQAMERAAVRLGRLVGYVSAGTVEYLYSHADDKFYFLELNPRLQVEHPTTEMVSGVNLPAAQLQVAMGLPLHRIRDIRLLYGVEPNGTSEIDFDFSDEKSKSTQRRPQPKGHVTACRITSEDPGEGFKPSGGTMQELNFRSSSNVWGYFSVAAAGGIHEFADSQFGHIFAYGQTRSESRKHMVVALKELSIRGDFRTTVEYLIKLLETPAFEDNTITTGWLDTLIQEKLTAERPDTTLAVLCGAVTKAWVASEECVAEYRKSLEKGQVPSKDILKTVFPIDFIYEGQRFRFTATRGSMDTFYLFINGSKAEVGVRALADGGLLILIDGRSHSVYFRDDVGAVRMSVDGRTCMLEQEHDPTQLRSPSPGKLVRFLVSSGEHVKAGQPFAEVEVMKMILPLMAQESGIVQFVKQPGASLAAGDILGILTLDDPSRVKHAQPYDGQLPAMGPPTLFGDKPPQIFEEKMRVIRNILQGFDNQLIMQSTLKDLIEVLRNPELPYGQWMIAYAALASRMPPKLEHALSGTVEKAHSRQADFPAKQLLKAFDAHFATMKPSDAEILRNGMSPLTKIAEAYREGSKVHKWRILIAVLDEYLATETLFSGPQDREDDVILKLRDENKDDINKVIGTVLSHARVGAKNLLVLAILEHIKSLGDNNAISKYFSGILHKLTELDSRQTAKVALKAREVLIQIAMPSIEERAAQMEHILKSAVVDNRYGDTQWEHRSPNIDVIRELVDSRYTVFDVLANFFAHPDPWVSLAALEVYVRRAYRAYSVLAVHYYTDGEPPFCLSWEFQLRSMGAPGLTGNGSQTPLHSVPPTPSGETTNYKRIASVSDMSFMLAKTDAEPVRLGAVLPVASINDVDDLLPRVLDVYERKASSFNDEDGLTMPMLGGRKAPVKEADEPLNVLTIAIRSVGGMDDAAISAQLQEVVEEFASEFRAHSLRRVTFICGREDLSYPSYFTYRGPDFVEDVSIRNMEPALAFQLELNRLSHFNITPVFTGHRNIHMYRAVGKEATGDKRYFTRALVRPGRLTQDMPTAEYLISETNRLVGDILDSIEVAGPEQTDLNHIFINFTPAFNLNPAEVENALGGFLDRFGRRLWRLRVTNAEIRIICADPSTGKPMPIRVLINNVSGFVVNVELYAEVKTPKGEWIFKSLHGSNGSMHLRNISHPYPTKEWLQPKRYKAHLMGTTYVYDFPELFGQAVRVAWQKVAATNQAIKMPEDILEAKELVLDESGNLAEVSREPGTNTCGMVAWIVKAKTPEYPAGRRFVVIANDITYSIGSFGPAEDRFFHKATQLARQLGIPRIYLSANSGARIGLAEELIPLFSAAWNDPTNPDKGFKYLYLTPEVYKRLEERERKIVLTEKIVEDGEERYKITTVIGATDGLGVECLQGSGLIAGETSRAYEDIFTITLVTCRSVGIGAYLVRLGQRAVQIEGQPIILTGAPAINKLLGREVYTSNLQLGGTQIMYKNGVSHVTAADDLEGISKIMDWLSYVPERRNAPVPISPSNDSWDREVEYTPLKGAYDVRWLIAGKEDEEGFQAGLFDKGSFQETLSGWARTVVVGRARLGGIPIGVIAVETRTVDNVIPADPANPDSTEQALMEAGQVWYPNSAFKTAQAINDFNHGEQLPLMILANWRGFSGGQRDMYNEVLKYGSYIVDALTKYKQPVFVYIPPYGELRGGSWVVVDPTINPDMMEMYADEESRAGVLEPEGIVGIKYRRDKLLDTMARLDSTYGEIKKALENPDLSDDEQSDLKVKLAAREKLLMPVYQQIAIQFADLHDRAGRMMAKGVIRQPLEWVQARRFFYWRLRRRLDEEYVLSKMSGANVKLSRADRVAKLQQWFASEHDSVAWEAHDREVAEWLERDAKTIAAAIEDLKAGGVADTINELAKSDKNAVLSAMAELLKGLSEEEKQKLLQ